MHHLNETAGTLTLIGSGEMTPGMASVHRRVMELIDGPVRPAFIDTPAGFELNVAGIAAKAVDYFREHFDLDLAVASFPSAADATPVTMERAMQTLRRANYIFSGPGSPTYAVRNWRNTPIFETIAGKVGAGAHLVLASAATLAMGRFTIPVYEIYKVGEDPHWVEGLDLLGRYGLDLAIVPHWNNTSGGTHDTTRCFIGESRFRPLAATLPTSTTVLGIDEYTACILMLREQRGEVIGAGGVTIQRADKVHVVANGQSFSFDLLRPAAGLASEAPAVPPPDQAAALLEIAESTRQTFRRALDEEHYPASAVGYLHGLMEATRRAGDAEGARAQVELMLREMLAALAIWLEEHPITSPSEPASELVEPLIELVVTARSELREAREWVLADRLRDGLLELGIVLEDRPDETHWRQLPVEGGRVAG